MLVCQNVESEFMLVQLLAIPRANAVPALTSCSAQALR
jgi:hypothetical protein